MKTKRLFATVLTLILMATSAFMLIACDDGTTYAWGKTFTFKGIIDDYNSYAHEENGSTGTNLDVLLKREFDKDNLKLETATINGETIDLSAAKTGDELIANMKQAALDRYNLLLKDVILTVGSKDSPSLTINDVTYEVVSNGEHYYEAVLPEGTEGYCGFDTYLVDNSHGKPFGEFCLWAPIRSGLIDLTHTTIYIETKEIVNDISTTKEITAFENGMEIITKTGILFAYDAVFSEVTD